MRKPGAFGWTGPSGLALVGGLSRTQGDVTYRQAVKPRLYGAVGDATSGTVGTDDTAELQAAIDAAEVIAAVTGRRALVDLGDLSYRITDQLVIDTARVDVTGTGTIWIDPAATTKTAFRVTAADTRFYGTAKIVGDVTVSNMLGIQFSGATRGSVTGWGFENIRSGGVRIDGACGDISVLDCWFHGGGYGVLTHSASTFTKLTVAYSHFLASIYGDAIEINTPTSGSAEVVIAGNHIDGYTHATAGFAIGVARVARATITGNIITGCREAIHIEDVASDIAVTGNIIDDAVRAGITVIQDEDPARVVLADNIVTAACSGGTAAAITVEGSGTAAEDIVVHDNIVHASGNIGFGLYGFRNSISHDNVATACTGSGFAFGAGNLSQHHDNRSRGNGGYGYTVSGAQNGTMYQGNIATGNTSGAWDISGATGDYRIGAHGAVDIARLKETGGAITLNSTSWVRIDVSRFNLTLDRVQAGDIVEVGVDVGMGTQAVDAYLDVVTLVSGSVVNWIAGDGSAGATGMLKFRTGVEERLCATCTYVVQSGDLSSGSLILQIRYRTSTATNRTMYAAAANPAHMWAKNLRQQPA